MRDKIADLIQDLEEGKSKFADVIAFIEHYYNHTPAAFHNGTAYNEATQNQGSAKVFSFARLHELSEQDTLRLFAEHYQAVLDTPEAVDHQNIRQFMVNGWRGVRFEREALSAK